MDDRAQSSGITFDELLAEVNKYSKTGHVLDGEQKLFLETCVKKKVSWPDIAKLWKLRWDAVGCETLRKRYHKHIAS